MITPLALVSMLCSLFVSLAQEEDLKPPPETEMKSLFNGEDLSGWDGDPKLWKVKNGVIRGETTKENPARGNTFLIWKEGRTKDFELRLSFRCNATNNSGIQYRSKHIVDGNFPNKWVVRGYQHEIRNELKYPNIAGFIYDEGGATGGRGRIIMVGQRGTWKGKSLEVDEKKLITKEEFQELFRLDQWNDVIIRAEGLRIRHYMNDRLILDFTDSKDRALLDGILAFQLHAGRPMFVEFKDIRIKDLAEKK